MASSSPNPLTFQDLILRLQTFWAEHGCVLQQPYDVEVGAGTMAPETFLRVLGPKPYRVGYVQPSRRPADGRYGENPNRLFKHMQYQVILKPPPANVQDLYLDSLRAIGIDLRKHDIKFEEDNWESPTLGAWGIGWQVMLDGLEITQFTYFQQCGGIDLDPISAELTYGLERIAAFLQDVDSIYDITWVIGPDGRPVKYGEIRLQDELQFSVYNFEAADVQNTWEHFLRYERECRGLLEVGVQAIARENTIVVSRRPVSSVNSGKVMTVPEQIAILDVPHEMIPRKWQHDRVGVAVSYLINRKTYELECGISQTYDNDAEWAGNAFLITCGQSHVSWPSEKVVIRSPLVLPAFDLCLKCSHLFNILDARGAISVTERVGVIARIRALAVGVAKAYVDQQQAEAASAAPAEESKEEQLAAEQLGTQLQGRS
jgi:glycyl-tRNA synthetase alpha chain